MTTIAEENEGDLAAPDFSQLLDLPEGTFGGSQDAVFGTTTITDPAQLGYCPDHPDDMGYALMFAS